MNIQHEASLENSREFSDHHSSDFSRDEIAVDWLEWVESIQHLHSWRQSDSKRYLIVNIDTDLPIDHKNFESLLLVDKIVINIESYVDGRVFSLARVLRDHLRFQGEIQASGDYLPDQVRFLRRCGIDTFSDQHVLDKTVEYFSAFYQPASETLENEVYIREARYPELAA